MKGVHEVLAADVVVVGAGVAGLMAAVGADDSPALHAADTLAAGAGLSDPAVVSLLTAEGPARMAALARRESRGGRYRADHPASDPRLDRRAFVVAGDATPS